MSNPILAFSAKRRMRSVRTPILLTVYSLMLSALACVIYAPLLGDTIHVSGLSNVVRGYALLVGIQFGLIVLVAPALTAAAISGERERQTLDLLLVTHTGAWRIVWGKLLDSFGFLALMILCSLPAMSLVLLVGGATLGQVMTSVAFLILLALEAECIALYCSTLFKRTVTSTVVSYLAVFGVGLLTLIPIFWDVKRIGDLYDAAGGDLEQIVLIPVAFTINPGLGLFSLLQEQTSLFDSAVWGVSYTLGNTITMVRYDLFLLCNMAFSAVASGVLVLLSGLHLRRLARRKT